MCFPATSGHGLEFSIDVAAIPSYFLASDPPYTTVAPIARFRWSNNCREIAGRRSSMILSTNGKALLLCCRRQQLHHCSLPYPLMIKSISGMNRVERDFSTNAMDDEETSAASPVIEVPVWLENISCLLHLAVFGILGVSTRYGLQKLFGPGGFEVTSDRSILYLDLPSNMVGCFLMGWFGVVFKPEFSRVSEHVATGLTTGYLGSLTTFSCWNQAMLDLTSDGHWLFSASGFLIGLSLAASSISFGVETANGFRRFLESRNQRAQRGLKVAERTRRVQSYRSHLAAMVALVLILGAVWSVGTVLLKEEFLNGGSGPKLWLAFLVGPSGVWIRWYLARLNGRGLGKRGTFRWLPVGTLTANVSAAVMMAALAAARKVVKSQRYDTIASGIQLGLLGCLSTVSTFMAEFRALRESEQPHRAYIYAMITVDLSFSLGILTSNLLVWMKI